MAGRLSPKVYARRAWWVAIVVIGLATGEVMDRIDAPLHEQVAWYFVAGWLSRAVMAAVEGWREAGDILLRRRAGAGL